MALRRVATTDVITRLGVDQGQREGTARRCAGSAGFLEAEKSFRKLRGQVDLRILIDALRPTTQQRQHNSHDHRLKPATEFGTSPILFKTVPCLYSEGSHGNPASAIFFLAVNSATECWPTFFMTAATSRACNGRT